MANREVFEVIRIPTTLHEDRLRVLGISEGVRLAKLRSAPFGDPVQVEIEGCRLSLSKSIFESLELRPITSPNN